MYRVIYVKLYRIFLCNYASICRWYDGIISCTHRCEIQNLSVVSHSQDFPEAPPLPAARHWPWHFQPKPQPILPYPSVRHSLKVLPKSSSQLQLRKSKNLLNLGNDAILLTTFDSFNFCLKIQTPSFQDQSQR